MKCDICIREAKPNHMDCPRCYRIISSRGTYHNARRDALKTDYVPPQDTFKCRITGVLTVDDKADPWCTVVCLVHPRKPPESFVASSLMAMVKTSFTLDEIRTVIPALDATLNNGKPFDPDIVPYAGWNRRLAATLPDVGLKARAAVRKCDICIRPARPGSLFCARCGKYITNRPERKARIAGLKEFYHAPVDGFLDAYLGFRLNDENPYDPIYLTLDHIEPGKSKQVPTSFWLNQSKGCLTSTLYKRVIAEAANHLRTGEPFDRNVIAKRDWNRHLMYMRLAGRKIA